MRLRIIVLNFFDILLSKKCNTNLIIDQKVYFKLILHVLYAIVAVLAIVLGREMCISSDAIGV